MTAKIYNFEPRLKKKDTVSLLPPIVENGFETTYGEDMNLVFEKPVSWFGDFLDGDFGFLFDRFSPHKKKDFSVDYFPVTRAYVTQGYVECGFETFKFDDESIKRFFVFRKTTPYSDASLVHRVEIKDDPLLMEIAGGSSNQLKTIGEEVSLETMKQKSLVSDYNLTNNDKEIVDEVLGIGLPPIQEDGEEEPSLTSETILEPLFDESVIWREVACGLSDLGTIFTGQGGIRVLHISLTKHNTVNGWVELSKEFFLMGSGELQVFYTLRESKQCENDEQTTLLHRASALVQLVPNDLISEIVENIKRYLKHAK